MIDFIKFLEEHKDLINEAKTVYDIFNATDYEDYQSKDVIYANKLLRVIMLCLNKIPITIEVMNYSTIESDLVFKAKASHGLTSIAAFKRGRNLVCNNLDDLVDLLALVIKDNLTGITSYNMRKFLKMTNITYEIANHK